MIIIIIINDHYRYCICLPVYVMIVLINYQRRRHNFFSVTKKKLQKTIKLLLSGVETIGSITVILLDEKFNQSIRSCISHSREFKNKKYTPMERPHYNHPGVNVRFGRV